MPMSLILVLLTTLHGPPVCLDEAY
jgi:hypothetical protein